MVKTMVTEWYRALQFQKCPRSRFLEFHLNGVGIQRRELAPAQLVSTLIRTYIGCILEGRYDNELAAQDASADFMNKGRARGFRTRNDFAEAQATAKKIHDVLLDFKPLDGYKVISADKEMVWNLTPRIRFVSKPVAVVSQVSGVYYLYYVKVTRKFKDEKKEVLARDFQLLSEMAAIKDAFPGEFAGALVQVISTDKLTYEPPFFIPYDPIATNSWELQVTSQEDRIEAVETLTQQYKDSTLDVAFGQYRHSCEFPYPCQFRDICWGDLSIEAKPENDPRYMKRDPELITEKELVASWGK